MADERVVSEIVTKFLLSTCLLRPQLTRHAVQAVCECATVATEHPVDDAEAVSIPLTTGSAAEFYIEQMLPLVGDIDVMFHRSTVLAIPRGHPPPTQLPDEFSNYVNVFEIVDSHLPGYVYLELGYLLTECIEDEKYNYFQCDNGLYLQSLNYLEDKTHIHGPAWQTHGIDTFFLPIDAVYCIRCLSWPPQAAGWPTRHRNYNWPDSATVDRVVSNGCDVVGVAHRQCKQHEWMGKHQWRLSFSRAEIVLINSWMPVQQIGYHMLRFFMKNEQFVDSADNSERFVVSNYHIKTLLLWTSELKPRIWWTESLNLVRICVELLHTLSVWLTDTCCPQYFISDSNCNLVDGSLSVSVVASELLSISESYLSTWFVHKYIGKCAELCPDYIPQLFGYVNTITKLQNVVTAIVEFRLNTSLHNLWCAVEFAQWRITAFMSKFGVTVKSCVCWMNELRRCDVGPCLSEYFSALACLHVTYKILRDGFNENLMDVLATILVEFIDTSRYSKQHSSVLSLNEAAKLMKVVANKSISIVQPIEIELSKVYLHRALRYKDSDSDSIYCLAHVYLAVLYYTTGEYQIAIDHCTMVTRSQDHSQCSSYVLQGELLPKIDDDIDNILGLTVFYQHVLSAALNQQRQRQYVSVFTTEIFAYYLHCRLLSVKQCRQVTQMSSCDIGKRCTKCISETEMHQLFIGDVLVFKSLNDALEQTISDKPEWRKCGQSAVSEIKMNTSQLVELLQWSAVERLKKCRQLESRYFDSIDTIVTTDFEALYAYKHGDYQRCLQLSTQNVHTLLNAVLMHNIPTYPEFTQLLDDDIVSLTALTLIVDPECRYNDNNSFISQLTLSLYLMTQCELKLHHSVTSLVETLDYIKVAQSRHPVDSTLDQLTLKLSECKAATYLRMLKNNWYN